MVRTQIYLPDDLYQELRLLAEDEHVNYSSLVREGVKEIIEKKKSKKKKGDWRKMVGIAKGGPKHVADRIDYYLYGEGRKSNH